MITSPLPVIQSVTQRIIERSQASRAAYLALIQRAAQQGISRKTLSCGNFAHGFAACCPTDKQRIRMMDQANVAIVTAYNDMLSAHQPYQAYPDKIKQALAAVGCTAQVAGGVPAMCDGVTQGQPGMELSLLSRDGIALATAIALSHNMFDAAVLLGICDKIVPGLLIGALRFGHLPVLFIPAGPMTTGLGNDEKAQVRQAYAQGLVDRQALLDMEARAYHGPGTCTFYGTANTNQMLMEIMGLQLPGSAFVNPDTPLREALTQAGALQATRHTLLTQDYRPLGQIVDEKAIVNAMVGLLATGGSTNLTIHLVTIAAAAGIQINWDDFAQLSAAVPLITRIYPNGKADINHFHAAGGLALVIRQLLAAGLLHDDVNTVVGQGLHRYTQEPYLDEQQNLHWRQGITHSLDPQIIATIDQPFSEQGGLQLLQGNLGRAIIKLSAVDPCHHCVCGPAVIFDSQQAFQQAFDAGQLQQDCVIVIRFQGPKANGMPELHKLTPLLGVLQDQGFAVALVTDGRMSGASGKVPTAIHLTPEASEGGPLARLRPGDWIVLNGQTGELSVQIDQAAWQQRTPQPPSLAQTQGMGRELFSWMRRQLSGAEQGATVFFNPEGDL